MDLTLSDALVAEADEVGARRAVAWLREAASAARQRRAVEIIAVQATHEARRLIDLGAVELLVMGTLSVLAREPGFLLHLDDLDLSLLVSEAVARANEHSEESLRRAAMELLCGLSNVVRVRPTLLAAKVVSLCVKELESPSREMRCLALTTLVNLTGFGSNESMISHSPSANADEQGERCIAPLDQRSLLANLELAEGEERVRLIKAITNQVEDCVHFKLQVGQRFPLLLELIDGGDEDEQLASLQLVLKALSGSLTNATSLVRQGGVDIIMNMFTSHADVTAVVGALEQLVQVLGRFHTQEITVAVHSIFKTLLQMAQDSSHDQSAVSIELICVLATSPSLLQPLVDAGIVQLCTVFLVSLSKNRVGRVGAVGLRHVMSLLLQLAIGGFCAQLMDKEVDKAVVDLLWLQAPVKADSNKIRISQHVNGPTMATFDQATSEAFRASASVSDRKMAAEWALLCLKHFLEDRVAGPMVVRRDAVVHLVQAYLVHGQSPAQRCAANTIEVLIHYPSRRRQLIDEGVESMMWRLVAHERTRSAAHKVLQCIKSFERARIDSKKDTEDSRDFPTNLEPDECRALREIQENRGAGPLIAMTLTDLPVRVNLLALIAELARDGDTGTTVKPREVGYLVNLVRTGSENDRAVAVAAILAFAKPSDWIANAAAVLDCCIEQFQVIPAGSDAQDVLERLISSLHHPSLVDSPSCLPQIFKKLFAFIRERPSDRTRVAVDLLFSWLESPQLSDKLIQAGALDECVELVRLYWWGAATSRRPIDWSNVKRMTRVVTKAGHGGKLVDRGIVLLLVAYTRTLTAANIDLPGVSRLPLLVSRREEWYSNYFRDLDFQRSASLLADIALLHPPVRSLVGDAGDLTAIADHFSRGENQNRVACAKLLAAVCLHCTENVQRLPVAKLLDACAIMIQEKANGYVVAMQLVRNLAMDRNAVKVIAGHLKLCGIVSERLECDDASVRDTAARINEILGKFSSTTSSQMLPSDADAKSLQALTLSSGTSTSPSTTAGYTVNSDDEFYWVESDDYC